MNGINIPKLVKQIKKAAKEHLTWQKTEEYEYIASRHWSVRTSGAAGTKVRTALYEVFGREVTAGQALSTDGKNVRENGPDITKIHYPESAKVVGNLTPIVILGDEKDVRHKRFVMLDNELLAVDSEYAEMTNETLAFGNGRIDPIFFGQNKSLLVLPFRVDGGWKKWLNNHLPGAYK